MHALTRPRLSVLMELLYVHMHFNLAIKPLHSIVLGTTLTQTGPVSRFSNPHVYQPSHMSAILLSARFGVILT